MILTLAYIGPGAGFAFLGSFLILIAALGLVIVSVLTWPFRAIAAALFRRRRAWSSVRRVVVVGLDGFDPEQYQRLSSAGRLPNLWKLEGAGVFHELQTTCPPISPVAWSTFMTGSNPGKHNIFDFLGRNPNTYLPELSSARIGTAKDGRPLIQSFRKSKPFWNVLGEHGVFSTILRVPITFPPEPFDGLLLSGMCVPDLRGTQGSFTLYGERPEADAEATGGRRIKVRRDGDVIRTVLPGPTLDGTEQTCPLEIDLRDGGAILRVGRQEIPLKPGSYSPWVRVPFRRVCGICRFLLVRRDPEFKLYVTPIQIDPERPALPISHPAFYSIHLAKLHGPFATLGLAEDTWALNEGAVDEAGFLKQVYAIHQERERMFFEALKRTRRGLCVCVFDASDRIQHMFPKKAGDTNPAHPLDEMYVRMDLMIGRVVAELGPDDVLIVMSDHGFTLFERGVNLNAWLKKNGYLHLKPGVKRGESPDDIDWSRTRAYALGLSGIYLNRKGREAQGIVEPDAGPALKAELAKKLKGLRDDAKKRTAIRDMYDAAKVYSGPYVDDAPDLIVGYERGYRASWDAATGKTPPDVFSDNPKHWSGDHCVDPALVPGVFFCNRKTAFDGKPGLADIAPTILELFGVNKPGYMDGRAARMMHG